MLVYYSSVVGGGFIVHAPAAKDKLQATWGKGGYEKQNKYDCHVIYTQGSHFSGIKHFGMSALLFKC